jgi:hypothetical protein
VFSVTVTGATAGNYSNTTGAVTSTEGGTGLVSNTATLSVGAAPPTIAKAFGTPSVVLNATTTLTFTLRNPNSAASLSGIAFTDTLPAGLSIPSANGLTGSCGTGTITATGGTNVVSLSGGTLAAGATCTFAVNVTGNSLGVKNNTTSAVTSTEGGTGLTASATVNVTAPSVPMSPWSLAFIACGLAAVGFLQMRRGRLASRAVRP